MQLRKKPHDAIVLPKPLYITKDPCGANAKYAGIYSKVDVGNIMRQADTPQFVDDSVLRVARDENITRYGQRSFNPKVNKEFRPPLRDPIIDKFPLSRIPVTTTFGHLNEKIPVEPQNNRNADIKKSIDQIRRVASVRPTYVIPLKSCDYERPFVKDRHRNVPVSSASAGSKFSMTCIDPVNDVELERRNRVVIGDAGLVSSIRYTPLSDDVELERKGAVVPVHAGYEPFTTPIDFSDCVADRDRNSPVISLSSGIAPIPEYAENGYSVPELERNRPQMSLSAGIDADYNTSIAEAIGTELDLDLNRPQTAVNINPSPSYRSINDGEFIEKPRIERESIGYSPIPDYNVRMYSHVEEPVLRQTTKTYNPGTFGSGATIPKLDHSYNTNPTLRSKGMRSLRAAA